MRHHRHDLHAKRSEAEHAKKTLSITFMRLITVVSQGMVAVNATADAASIDTDDEGIRDDEEEKEDEEDDAEASERFKRTSATDADSVMQTLRSKLLLPPSTTPPPPPAAAAEAAAAAAVAPVESM